MKKSVVLAIVVVYVFAIVIVGFIGIRMKIYNPDVNIETIICETEGYSEIDEHNGIIKRNYEKNLAIIIKCKYLPLDANQFPKGYPFEYICYEKPSDYKLTVLGDGTCKIEFYRNCTCDVTVKAQDSHQVQLKISIQIMPNDDEMCEIYGILC